MLKEHKSLFLMQICTTIAFSVMYSTLVLYATQGLHLESHYAVALTSGFLALNFVTHVLGGYLCGRFLSYRGLYVLGMLLQCLGCLIITIPNFQALIWGTAIFLSSCGLNAICINCMITQFFAAQDKKREEAFLWNYSGLNFGFIIGFTVSGIFQIDKNFQAIFAFAAAGSLVAFVIAIFNWKLLADQATIYSGSNNRVQRTLLTGSIIICLMFVLVFLLEHLDLSNQFVGWAGVVVTLFFVCLAYKEPMIESSKKIAAFIILGVSSLIFWTLYQMAPTGLTLFFQSNVDRVIMGFSIPPQWIININPAVIVFGGPLLAAINQVLRRKGFQISIPFQFITALFLIGVSFLLPLVGICFADAKGFSSIGWLVGSYVFQSVGELFISPIGFAMIGQLIPSRFHGIAMGAWFMNTGLGALMANSFSQTALGSSEVLDPLVTNPTFSATFLRLACFSIAGSVILLIIRPLLHKLIQEKRCEELSDLA